MSDDDTIIPIHLVEAAQHRDIEDTEGVQEVWALDVARYGTDATALCKRRGSVVTEIKSWRGLDLMQTTGRVMAEYNEFGPFSAPPGNSC